MTLAPATAKPRLASGKDHGPLPALFGGATAADFAHPHGSRIKPPRRPPPLEETMDEFGNSFLINALIGFALALLVSFVWVWFN
jgi:hypothetical protein